MRKLPLMVAGLATLAPLMLAGQAPAYADGNRDGIDACAQEAKLAGFAKDRSSEGRNDDAIHAVAIAMAESGCRHDARHQNNPNDPDPGSWDLGAWQINERWHPDVHGRDANVVTDENWKDMGWSARKAYEIDKDPSGRGWAAWAAWNLGTYRQYLDQARDAVYRNW
ncbi:hypothetical protein ACX9I7_20165 [Streptomyces sp. L500]|uniref:hypothetical protein n=1 Tax=Streptomyces abikoensis TaxID=97398 RepID=UPI0036AF9B96